MSASGLAGRTGSVPPSTTRRTLLAERGGHVVALLLLLGMLGGGVGAAAAADGRSGTAPEAGHRLYLGTCAGCHGPDATGDGPDADLSAVPPPALRGSTVLARHSDAELIAFVREGRRFRVGIRPALLAQHAQETDTLVTFLQGLPGRDWDTIDAGADVYRSRCLPCHDAYGRPQATVPAGVQRPPRDLSQRVFQTTVDDAALIELVRHGRHGMPTLVPHITDEESRQLVAYVRLLSPGYALYTRYCQVCHGAHGEGAQGVVVEATAPRLVFDDEYFWNQPPERIRHAVWHMLREAKPTMPHFSAVLDDQEVATILRWLRSLPPPAPSPAPAGAPPDAPPGGAPLP